MSGNLEQLLAGVLAIYKAAGGSEATAADSDQAPYSGLISPPAVGPDDEYTIVAVMRLLRQVTAIAERAATLPPPPPSTVYAVLSGAELTMRWEYLAGRGADLPGLLPGFTYLATVFFLDRQSALRRSAEVRALVEQAGFEVR